MADLLDNATQGDQIPGSDLQQSIQLLRQLASDLDATKTDDLSVSDLQAIGQLQSSLNQIAGNLVVVQIDLLVGQAKITADHINAAVQYANNVIQNTQDLKDKLAKVAALIAFFGVVVTGNGKAILDQANTLKKALDT